MSPLPVIVVGNGIAGLSAALAAAPQPVLLLGRGIAGADSASLLAQGGIAAAVADDDSPAEHAEDTVRCGAGFNDVEAVDYLAQNAVAAVHWLQQQGVVFDSDAQGVCLAREGGHGRARVLHVGGDATGAGLLRALQAVARCARHIHWREGVEVVALLQRNRRVVGVEIRDRTDQRERIEGAAVVLATGGLGGLFAATSNPLAAQGFGLALAASVGAPLRDIELIQFHPTALNADSMRSHPLVTEALRGAGAILRNQQGHALLQGVHQLADLAPRDTVSRCVWQAQQRGDDVFLDARSLTVDWSACFPTVRAACLAAGIDPQKHMIPVTPVAHFHMGGIAVDLDGRTGAEGLYAVGEVACNGVHGANRLASNALLEAVVFGRRMGDVLRRLPTVVADEAPMIRADLPPSASDADLCRLRALLWQAMGPIRTAASLHQAMATIADNPGLSGSWQGTLACSLLSAAVHRSQSCGAHFRADAVSATALAATAL